MNQVLDVLRGLVGVLIAAAVLATMVQAILGDSLAAVLTDFTLPIVVLFVVLMLFVLGREVWTVLAARR